MKVSRHAKIIELISQYDIETQEELADRSELSKGFISHRQEDDGMNEKYIRVLRDGFVSMDMAQNILVIKTVAGMAMAVAAAVDAMKWNEVVGCIAGDDTIMCAIRTVEDTAVVMENIRKLVSRKA